VHLSPAGLNNFRCVVDQRPVDDRCRKFPAIPRTADQSAVSIRSLTGPRGHRRRGQTTIATRPKRDGCGGGVVGTVGLGLGRVLARIIACRACSVRSHATRLRPKLTKLMLFASARCSTGQLSDQPASRSDGYLDLAFSASRH